MTANFVIDRVYRVRAAALATEDVVLRGVLLSLIEETEDQALEALQKSCWAEDLRDDPQEQRMALRTSLMLDVPCSFRPAGWPGGTNEGD